MSKKYLDLVGLQHYDTKMKTYIDTKAPTNIADQPILDLFEDTPGQTIADATPISANDINDIWNNN